MCNEDTEKCALKDIFVPDPRHFDLPEDFIYIENEWGSLFYKHLGKMARNDARKNCSSFGSSVHLPIPRFIEEYEFYRAHFGYNGQSNADFKGLLPLNPCNQKISSFFLFENNDKNVT